MAGFNRHQYSDYSQPNVSAWVTYTTMLALTDITPPGKLSTTLGSLKMHFIPDIHIFDVTDSMKLGGIYAPQLHGPAPRALVTRLRDLFQAQFPGQNFPPFGNAHHPFILPVATKRTAASINPRNWVE